MSEMELNVLQILHIVHLFFSYDFQQLVSVLLDLFLLAIEKS